MYIWNWKHIRAIFSFIFFFFHNFLGWRTSVCKVSVWVKWTFRFKLGLYIQGAALNMRVQRRLKNHLSFYKELSNDKICNKKDKRLCFRCKGVHLLKAYQWLYHTLSHFVLTQQSQINFHVSWDTLHIVDWSNVKVMIETWRFKIIIFRYNVHCTEQV